MVGNCICTLIVVSFVNNKDGAQGGAIFIQVTNGHSTTITLKGCFFDGNSAVNDGDDIFIQGVTALTFESCPSGGGYAHELGEELQIDSDGSTINGPEPYSSYRCYSISAQFAGANNGATILMPPGTLTEGDGISDTFQLSFYEKHVTIECDVTTGACVWKGAAGKGVVRIWNSAGTTTLSQIIIRNGDGYIGGGLRVTNSVVLLDRVSFIKNHANAGGAVYVEQGASTVTMQGCTFSGNLASTGRDVQVVNGQTASVTGCPE
ncbi:hypothetical protein ScalyP_jg143, partial [Parmales sp. scaly parma]